MDMAIKRDLYRHGGLAGVKGFLRGWFIPGFRFMFLLRKAAAVERFSLRGVCYRWLLRHYSYKYGYQIAVGTQIGEGFYIGHFGLLVISPAAKIGKFCNVAHGVTIGRANRGELKGAPTLGDKVWVGANAVVVGNVKVGSNVLIAPGSFVNMDIPDNSLVLGNPARIIQKDDATEGYVENIPGL